MNVEIGTQAAQFPKKEYITGIFVVVLKRTPAKLCGGLIGAKEYLPKNQYVQYKQGQKVTVRTQIGDHTIGHDTTLCNRRSSKNA
jgi:hypothetical protein